MAERINEAAEAVVRAIRDAGPQPEYHAAVMRRHQQEWPTLWRALERLVSTVADACMACGHSLAEHGDGQVRTCSRDDCGCVTLIGFPRENR